MSVFILVRLSQQQIEKKSGAGGPSYTQGSSQKFRFLELSNSINCNCCSRLLKVDYLRNYIQTKARYPTSTFVEAPLSDIPSGADHQILPCNRAAHGGNFSCLSHLQFLSMKSMFPKKFHFEIIFNFGKDVSSLLNFSLRIPSKFERKMIPHCLDCQNQFRKQGTVTERSRCKAEKQQK